MGRKMIKCAALDLVSESLTSEAPVQSDYKQNGTSLLKSEAALEYLCNLPPHRSHLVNSPMIFIFWCCMSSNRMAISDMKLLMQKTFQR